MLVNAGTGKADGTFGYSTGTMAVESRMPTQGESV